MLNIINDLNNIKNSNLFFLLEDKKDVSKLDFLNLDEKYVKKINEIIKKNKNTIFDFFIGNDNFEKIYIAFYLEKDKNIIEFLSGKLKGLENKITLLPNKKENTITMIDCLLLTNYKLTKYKKEDEKEFNVLDFFSIEEFIKNRVSTIKNIYLARDFVGFGPNDKSPKLVIDMIKKLGFKNIKLKILTHKDILDQGLNLIDAVGKGSINKPAMVILEKIENKDYKTYGFVGKGVLFDSGGYNLKSDNWLYPMKDDMGGAATVLYTMNELDDKKLGVNIVGAIPLVENLISGVAYRPSDVITGYNGKTVDIINTDAEGRLVLADAMSYISKNYNLDVIITVATLTGAAMYAIGYNYAAIMGDHREIIDILLKNSESDWEKYWELPYNDFYKNKTKGIFSDLQNLTDGVYAGSSMGGAFLSNYLDNGEKFVHIDIAGVANVPDDYGLYLKGATGFGVDSLSKLFLRLK